MPSSERTRHAALTQREPIWPQSFDWDAWNRDFDERMARLNACLDRTRELLAAQEQAR